MKILCIFGTRPEAIKLAPVIQELRKNKKKFSLKICSTGQHKELLKQALDNFDLKTDFDFEIMKTNQSLENLTIKVFKEVSKILDTYNPEIVMVHGDTTTSFAASLAAFYKKIKIAHVEAGLRSFVLDNPWPEEFNRKAISDMTTYHFAPTNLSKKNLLSEGVLKKNIIVTGNTVIDSLFLALKKIERSKKIKDSIQKEFSSVGLNDLNLNAWMQNKRKLVLITGHRRESFGEGFKNICSALKSLSKSNPHVDFVYPVHLNPNVRDSIKLFFGKACFSKTKRRPKNLFFIDPLGYFPFIKLMQLSSIVLTDSGGIQEEAPSFKKPVLLMRKTTERPEALEAGTVKKVGTNTKMIISEVQNLLDNELAYKEMISRKNPYGDGKASERIFNFLKKLNR